MYIYIYITIATFTAIVTLVKHVDDVHWNVSTNISLLKKSLVIFLGFLKMNKFLVILFIIMNQVFLFHNQAQVYYFSLTMYRELTRKGLKMSAFCLKSVINFFLYIRGGTHGTNLLFMKFLKIHQYIIGLVLKLVNLVEMRKQ